MSTLNYPALLALTVGLWLCCCGVGIKGFINLRYGDSTKNRAEGLYYLLLSIPANIVLLIVIWFTLWTLLN